MSEFRRGKECPHCHVDWWEKGSDWENGAFIHSWVCPNCSFKEPRRKNKVGEGISPSQEKAREAVRARLLRPLYAGQELEVKEEPSELNKHGDLVYRIVVGHKGDENNGLYLVRSRMMVFIGRSGGLRAFNKALKMVSGRKVFLECVEH